MTLLEAVWRDYGDKTAAFLAEFYSHTSLGFPPGGPAPDLTEHTQSRFAISGFGPARAAASLSMMSMPEAQARCDNNSDWHLDDAMSQYTAWIRDKVIRLTPPTSPEDSKWRDVQDLCHVLYINFATFNQTEQTCVVQNVSRGFSASDIALMQAHVASGSLSARRAVNEAQERIITQTIEKLPLGYASHVGPICAPSR